MTQGHIFRLIHIMFTHTEPQLFLEKQTIILGAMSPRAQVPLLAYGPSLAAHPGDHQTYLNLRNQFYFPNMSKESQL